MSPLSANRPSALWVAAMLGLALWGFAQPAAAQSRVKPKASPKAAAGARSQQRSLRTLAGVKIAKALLDSDEPADRLRGIARLATIGTTEATDALLEQFEQGSTIARDPQSCLEAVRALAPHAPRENVRQVLIREMTGGGVDGRGVRSPLSGLAQHAAALALARSGEKKALTALVNAVLQGGTAGEAAAEALRAYPPLSLSTMLQGRRRIAPVLATLFGDMGDLRALERLRKMLDDNDPAAKLAAAVALAKLGDDAPLKIAREWMKRTDGRLQRAAAQVLVYLNAPDAPKAIEVLLANDSTRRDGVRLALVAPSPAIAKALARAITHLPEQDRAAGVAALGRAGGPDIAGLLTGLLANPELSTPAAFALATVPGDEARQALQRAMASPTAQSGPARRLIVRAAVVRALVQRDVLPELAAALEGMQKSKDAADRAVAAFGLASTATRSIRELVEQACPGATQAEPGAASISATCDPVVIGAVARAALQHGPDSLALWMPLLVQAAGGGASDSASSLAVAAGVAMLANPSGGALATSQLATWAEAGGPLAPLAARALPARDDTVMRGRIKRLLGGSDPVVRAHVALGLAHDPEPDAVSLLTGAYRFEEDAAVRRAIVRALSRRREIQRNATLTLARDLDADQDVRSLARSALEGRTLDIAVVPQGATVAWISIVANHADAVPSVRGRAARIVRSDGLAFPVLADPDGVLVVPGLPAAAGSLVLAPAQIPGDAGH